MKHHVMMAMGLLMAAIFSFMMANALVKPGLGIAEAYYAGGLAIAGFLLHGGWREWQATKAEATENTD
ncbi:MAG: hypothetical protein AAF296_06900 [Pseudomonadota bacterium]